MKILSEAKMSPFTVMPGDSVTLSHTNAEGEREVVLEHVITEELAGTYDHACVFKIDEDEFEGSSGGIGGAFLKPKI
jgi:hypothetical protein